MSKSTTSALERAFFTKSAKEVKAMLAKAAEAEKEAAAANRKIAAAGDAAKKLVTKIDGLRKQAKKSAAALKKSPGGKHLCGCMLGLPPRKK